MVITAITGLYYALVAFGNITDSSTNYHFVDHVFAMDTTFKDKDVMWRHIDNNGVVTVAYRRGRPRARTHGPEVAHRQRRRVGRHRELERPLSRPARRNAPRADARVINSSARPRPD
jgi:hypothetical protein